MDTHNNFQSSIIEDTNPIDSVGEIILIIGMILILIIITWVVMFGISPLRDLVHSPESNNPITNIPALLSFIRK